VRPSGPGSLPIDLKALVDDLRSRGINLPVLIRFSDILRTRVEQLFGAFQQAIAENDYKGSYRGVYPIKVNQQRHVVEELMEYGRPFNLGIEAGSKPELLVALALQESPDALILCNGYKDPRVHRDGAARAEARAARRDHDGPDGRARDDPRRRRRARPAAGDRCARPLTTKGAGKWVESTGDRSKFGLTTAEIVSTVDRLRAVGMLDCLQLLHFHIGSQITNIRRGEGRSARVEPDLRRAARDGRQHALPRLRRRARRRLRRQPDELPLVGQLHAAGVRGRHREPGGRGLQRGAACRTRTSSPSREGHIVAHHSVLVYNVLATNRDSRRQGTPRRLARATIRSCTSSGRPTRDLAQELPGGVPRRAADQGGGDHRLQPGVCSTSRRARASRRCSGPPARSC
jgi:hypothetical protein